MDRMQFAVKLAESAGQLALRYFRTAADLDIISKGHQDAVSDADIAVERFIREVIQETFPDDAILGEEGGRIDGSSSFTWVIDPIDGTMNFINSIPVWAVVVACVRGSETIVGVVHDPLQKETFAAEKGKGARLNGRDIHVVQAATLSSGTVAVGISNRSSPAIAGRIVDGLMQRGGLCSPSAFLRQLDTNREERILRSS